MTARLPGLDVLRLLAVLLVILDHLRPAPPDGWALPARRLLEALQRGGWVGVDLFFVLSGFLASGLLFAEYKASGRLSVGRFLLRRGAKIYPPFWALLAISLILFHAGHQRYAHSSLLAEVFFVQSYVPGLWLHTWSLAVEEHFYLLLVLLLSVVLRLNRDSPAPFRRVPFIALGVAAFVLALRFLHWHERPAYSLYAYHFATHLRIDSLFLGVAISYFHHFHTSEFVSALRRWRYALIAGGLALLVPPFLVPHQSPIIFTVGFTAFACGSGMLMVGVLLCDLPRSRWMGVPATLGAHSYSIYLWNLPVRYWGTPLIERALGPSAGFGIRAAIYVIATLSVGVAMAKLIEIPALRSRDRWIPSRSGATLAASPPSVVKLLDLNSARSVRPTGSGRGIDLDPALVADEPVVAEELRQEIEARKNANRVA